MYKVIDKEQNVVFSGDAMPRYDSKSLSVVIPTEQHPEEYVAALQNAATIEVYADAAGLSPAASYRLVGWQAVERLWDGMKIVWQVYAPDELAEMQARLDDMTQSLETALEALALSENRVATLTNALLELGSIVGTAQSESEEQPEEKPQAKTGGRKRKKETESND